MKTEQSVSACPYCGEILEKRPKRKKKCHACQNYIYVRTLPATREKVLVTEAQAKEINEEWSKIQWRQRWLGFLSPYGISEADFKQIKRERFSKFGIKTSDSDVIWSLFNRAVHENHGDFQTLQLAYHSMAAFLDEEGRDFKPLQEQSARMQLMGYRQSGIEKVCILSAGSGNSCEACQKQDGAVFTVDEILRSMPIPCKYCTKLGISGAEGFCRCLYLAVIP